MKICGHCGAQCDDRDVFCNSCGTAFPSDNAQQQGQQYYGQYGDMPPYQQQGQYNPYQNPYQYQQYYVPGFVPPRKRTAPLVLGIIGIVFAILLPLVTYCCSIPGLVMASRDINLGAQGRGYQALNIIALVIAVINSILGVILNNYIFY